MLSLLRLAWSFSHLHVDIEEGHVNGTSGPSEGPEAADVLPRKDVHLRGAGTFVVLPQLARELDKVDAGQDVHVHLEHLDHVDHACFDLLSDWRARYESRGGKVTLEWDTLQDGGAYRPTERVPGLVAEPAAPLAPAAPRIPSADPGWLVDPQGAVDVRTTGPTAVSRGGPRARPQRGASSTRGLVRCVHCGGRGCLEVYSVYGAANRSPYSTRPCPVCLGGGESLGPSPRR